MLWSFMTDSILLLFIIMFTSVVVVVENLFIRLALALKSLHSFWFWISSNFISIQINQVRPIKGFR